MGDVADILKAFEPYLTLNEIVGRLEFLNNEKFMQHIEQVRQNRSLISKWDMVVQEIAPAFDDSYGLLKGYFSASHRFDQTSETSGFVRINVLYNSYCVFFEETQLVNGNLIRPRKYIDDEYLDIYEKCVTELESNTISSESLNSFDQKLYSPYIRISPVTDKEIEFSRVAAEVVERLFSYPLFTDINRLNTKIPDTVAFDGNGDWYSPTAFEYLFNLGFQNLVYH